MEGVIRELKSLKPVVVYDETKSVLTIPAEVITGDVVNQMMKNCDEIRVALPWKHIIRLGLNKFKLYNGNAIPIDFKAVSAEDRAKFIKNLVHMNIRLEDIVYPGRIFVEEAKEGGVLERPAFGEASLDLSRLSGFKLAGVYATIMTEDGCIANSEYGLNFAKENGYTAISINELIEFRLKNEKLVERVVSATLPTKFYGTFKAIGYKTPIGEIIALVKGDVSKGNVLVRIHSECLTGDVFHSLRCDCGEQLERALKMIDKEGRGVLIYMRGHEGRGIGLINKLMAYKLQEEGKDTVEANIELGFPPDLRSYGISAQILIDLGVRSIRLMTNNPLKIDELKKYGFKVVREPIIVEPVEENREYIKTKVEKMGHIICIND
jgi:3,4-dihydroxy 2-butanone 4-phosphate synthase/GTP cyclohydrolase II